MSRSSDTRKVYAMEAMEFKGHSIKKSTPIAGLRSWLEEHWPSASSRPRLIAHRGVRYLGALYSWYDPETHTIGLARNQRNLLTLVHEMTHAKGYGDHDNTFQRIYFRQLAEFNVKEVWKKHKLATY